MTPFEKLIERSFVEYSTAKLAVLKFVYPKMRMTGEYIGKAPAFLQVGKGPYDLDGYYTGTGRYIACELKENGERHASMRIIPPDKKGTGLQYHQLQALVEAHEGKAFVCVLWDNAGEIGILDGTRLVAAKAAMDTSLKAQEKGFPDAARGSRSIPWGSFSPVKLNGDGVPLWLPNP